MGFFTGNSGRTERATARRRSEARKKGQIARSPALPSSIVLLGLFFLLKYHGSFVYYHLSDLLRRFLMSANAQEFTQERLQQILLHCATDVSTIVIPFLLTASLLSVGANVAQGGLVFSTYRLGFRFENLSPAAGIKRLLPGTGGKELLKNLFTIGVVSYLTHSLYAEVVGELPRYVLMSPLDISLKIGGLVSRLAIKCGWSLLLIALADYFWQRHEFKENLKMTKEEIKDEVKNAEGNPEVRSRIRKKQREMGMKYIMATVPKADVVITNPTHFAVALSYERERMAAPTVVAKGQDFMAQRIRQIAEENQVPLVENKLLAQTLYKTVEVGQQIPANLFKAVAEVLAYVYKLKNTRL